MAACQICKKAVSFGKNVSHSKRRTARVWLPNVHRRTLAIDGVPQRVYVCTRCLRTKRKVA
ncbi:MAG: 50S ribosomal protein L28 [Chloroflexi bacterium]|nr:50S ribosomal protein L28 [Chloroflexota bacterium]